MSSKGSYGSSMLFQTITEDLNSSLAMADELSREFNSLMNDINSSAESSKAPTSRSGLQASSSTSSLPDFTSSNTGVSGVGPRSSSSRDGGGGGINRGTMSLPQTSTTTIGTTASSQPNTRSPDSIFPSPRNSPASPSSQYGLPPTHKPRQESGYSHGQMTPPNQSPHTQRRASPRSHERNLSGSFSYAELVSSPGHKYEHQSTGSMLQQPAGLMLPQESSTMGRRSPRMDRVPSPSHLSQPVASTLPRNFMPFKQPDEGLQRQRSPAKWNETDLDVSYERKPHHTYDRKEWVRPTVPGSNWRESNLDSPSTPRKEPLVRQFQAASGSLPRTTRISVPPDHVPPTQSPYQPQPIISRISIPPSTPRMNLHRPIPLSVIMRLQNPYYTAATHYPKTSDAQMNQPMYRQPIPLPREYLYQLQQPLPEQRQPPYYGEVLKQADVDAEVERLNTVKPPVVQSNLLPIPEQGGQVPVSEQGKETRVEVNVEESDPPPAPRPLSPTRLQPVVAPEVPVVPNLEELLLLRAEIPRALKRRGSVDQSQSQKKMPIIQPNQYKQMINRLFRRKGQPVKGETGSESSSSDSEESVTLQIPTPTLRTMPISAQEKGLHSILRKSAKANKTQSPRARLSPLVLLLDGALVGELETVQRAVQEMSDPSQPNDEGITALHNAICGGHYAVVEFLVQIGANVSAPDSHGWTPLHCAASCNDRVLCEYLVRNGAAVMAVTESDGATAAQKCDPYAEGYEECESFLRGVEEMMGVENSGVLYALWSYPAQAPDELSFREGDMVTILQKPEGVDWWWASLCGREGFIPNNYFGLFPKVRPKSLC